MKKQVFISSLSLAVIFALSACGSSEEPVRQRPLPPGDQRDLPPPRLRPRSGPGGRQQPIPQPIPNAGGPDVGGPDGGGPGPQGVGPQGIGPQGAAPQGAGPQGGAPGPNLGQNPGQVSGNRTSGPSRAKSARNTGPAANQSQNQNTNPNQNSGQGQQQLNRGSQAQESLGTSKSSTEDKSKPTAAENKAYRADFANLERTEKSLEGVGLKLKYDVDANQVKTGLNWDTEYMTDYKGSIREDAPAPLQTYRLVLESFMKKYQSRLSKEDYQIVQSKLALANRYIVALDKQND